MAQVEGTIHAGACGFVTRVLGRSEDGQRVNLELTTDCPNMQQLAAALVELDAYSELGAGYQGQLYSLVAEHVQRCCCGCVVPAGLLKAMQIAAGLALPQSVSMEFAKSAGHQD